MRYEVCDLDTWFSDFRYLGREGLSLYPFWKDKFKEFYAWCKSHPSERSLILSSATRSGKSSFLAHLCVRLIYEVGAEDCFPLLFDLSPTTVPKILVLTYTMQKGSSQLIKRVHRILKQSPFFSQKGMKPKNVTSTVVFPFIEVLTGVDVSHLQGDDVLAVFLDEANLRNAAAANVIQETQDLYFEMKSRVQSTFIKHGKTAGIAVLSAQVENQTSFVEQEIEQAKITGNTMIVQAAMYDVRPTAFSTETFSVFPGSPEIEPFILLDGLIPESVLETFHSIQTFEILHKDHIHHVPMNFLSLYKSNIVLALKRISGVVSTTTLPFVRIPTLLKCFNPDWKNPCSVDMPKLGLYDPYIISDYLDISIMRSNGYTNQDLFVHFDASLKYDYTGVGIVYYDHLKNKIVPLWYSDVYYGIENPDNEISTSKLFDIVRWLVSHNMSIKRVTADSYGSTYIIQQAKLLLGDDGGTAQVFSVDAAAHLMLLQFIKQGLFESYRYVNFEREYPQLVYDPMALSGKGKVDHKYNPSEDVKSYDHFAKNRSDVSDALAGAVCQCAVYNDISPDHVIISKNIEKMSRKLAESDLQYRDMYQEALDDPDDFYGNLENYQPDSASSDDPLNLQSKMLNGG